MNAFLQNGIKQSAPVVALAAVLAGAGWLSGCVLGPGASGEFDRTFTVNGPVHLEVANGSGNVKVTAGAAGEVRVHGEIHTRQWGSDGDQSTVNQLRSNPPVSQDGNLIRIGSSDRRLSHTSIDYTVEVPTDAEIHGSTGSGDVEFDGIHGPATFSSGSGNITADSIASDVQVKTGSGDLELEEIQGQTLAESGSGNIKIHTAKGAVRVGTGSGDVVITQPGDNVIAETGSGDIEVENATADLRLQTGSGTIKVGGNPGAMNYWDIHSGSGDVTLNVPQTASFRLYAHTGSGGINAQMPVVMEGTAGKHELRARIGDGKARVEIGTSSGTIELR